MKRSAVSGHLSALICQLVWGTTFSVTKLLQSVLAPIEILFLRFLIGYCCLWLLYPHPMHLQKKKDNLLFAGAGLTGVVLYFLLENFAVKLTLASNVGVIVSVCPFFTAIVVWAFSRGQHRPHGLFFLGFGAAMLGIVLINYNGLKVGGGSRLGDLLTVGAAFAWAFYSVLCTRITSNDLPVIACTRRIFFFGLIWMLPLLPLLGFSPDPAVLATPGVAFGLLYLGMGASGVCFVLWNYATSRIGAVKTAAYIYLAPVISIATAAIVLGEPITPLSLAGIALTLLGLVLSERSKRTAFEAD